MEPQPPQTATTSRTEFSGLIALKQSIRPFKYQLTLLIADVTYALLELPARAYEAGQIRRMKKTFKSCGKGTYIGPQCIFRQLNYLELGDNVCINSFTYIFADGGVKIGNNSMISAHCAITSITHPNNAPNRLELPLIKQPVVIGNNVWLGMGVVVLPGITIGDDAIVGAGAVVTKDVPPKTVVVGNPAKILKPVEF